MSKKLFNDYLDYVGESESPTIYHRWALLSLIGALLGRQAWIPFGHQIIYPNQYILLMGTAGARKSSAMEIAKNLLKDAGYKKFAPSKTSKERLLMEMQAFQLADIDGEDVDLELLVMDIPAEIYVCKGEFIDFLGINDMGFMTLLTDLWDNLPEYDNPKITRKSVKVDKPTISILGGATPHSIAMAIPTEQLELGFTSRILFIFSEPTGKKITFPERPCPDKKAFLLSKLKAIKETVVGEISYDSEAKEILSRIYKEFKPLDDSRFSKYSARRFTHLLKITLILAAMAERTTIIKEDCIHANTILHAAEIKMSKALGEFGRSRYSNVSNMIIEYMNHLSRPVTMTELWKLVSKDLTKISELGDIMQNLQKSEKIQVITLKDKQGYMTKHTELKTWDSDLIDDSFLQLDERIF